MTGPEIGCTHCITGEIKDPKGRKFMPGTNQSTREPGAAPLSRPIGRDLIWALGLLVALGSVSWIFDRALDLL
jgi:hypothetical protein